MFKKIIKKYKKKKENSEEILNIVKKSLQSHNTHNFRVDFTRITIHYVIFYVEISKNVLLFYGIITPEIKTTLSLKVSLSEQILNVV